MRVPNPSTQGGGGSERGPRARYDAAEQSHLGASGVASLHAERAVVDEENEIATLLVAALENLELRLVRPTGLAVKAEGNGRAGCHANVVPRLLVASVRHAREGLDDLEALLHLGEGVGTQHVCELLHLRIGRRNLQMAMSMVVKRKGECGPSSGSGGQDRTD